MKKKFSELPRELKDVLKAYEISGKKRLTRKELRSYCEHLPGRIFELALGELVYRKILRRLIEDGRVCYEKIES